MVEGIFIIRIALRELGKGRKWKTKRKILIDIELGETMMEIE